MDELQKKVVDAVDEDFLVKTTMELVDIPSPTGYEENAARYMHAKYEEAGFEAHLQKVAEGRYNAVGISPGTGGGYSVMFNGHLDTSYSGEEPELTQPGYKNKAIRDGDWIIGNGAANMKSADVSYLGAAKALADAGVKLKGDIVLASVAGEIEKNRIDQYQDVLYDGYGVGTRHLISHGYLTDFCILGEPTGMQVAPWHGGTIWFKVITRGSMGHTCYGHYTASAIERMERVQAAVRKWIPEYRERNEFLGERPHVNVAAIEGGWPYRCARSPIECRLYVDVRLVPGQTIQNVEVEFKELIAQVNEEHPDVGAKVEVFSSHPPSGIPVDSLPSLAMINAHEEIVGEKPNIIVKTSYLDAAHMNRYGIQTITYGLAGRTFDADYGWNADIGEHIHVDALVDTTKIFALAALDLCTREREETAIAPDPYANLPEPGQIEALGSGRITALGS